MAVTGAKWTIRIRDLSSAKARCILCRHEEAVDLSRFDPIDRLVDIEPKLRCSACGNPTENFFPRECLFGK